MRETEPLPPSRRDRLSAWGWVAVASSLLLGATLLYSGWAIAAMMYLIVIFVGILVGLPGGMNYQADVDAYLAKHPTLSRATLPWPADYTQLSRKQAWRYSTRGLSAAATYGILMPVQLLLGALVDLRILRAGLLGRFYKHDEAA